MRKAATNKFEPARVEIHAWRHRETGEMLLLQQYCAAGLGLGVLQESTGLQIPPPPPLFSEASRCPQLLVI